MFMKLRIPTGAGKEALLMYIQAYRDIGVICAPVLKPQYEEFAQRLRREYQITLHVFDRNDYHHENIQDQINNENLRLDMILIDDYPDTLMREFGYHPKVPMFVNMQEYFYEKKIIMLVLE